MTSFNGATAVITGGASGIGRALSLKAADEGMNLCVADMNGEALQSLTDELTAKGTQLFVKKLDVSDAAALQEFADECFARFGVVDLLFNNAGILRIGGSWDLTADQWSKMISVNVMGVVNGINAFVPKMVELGKPARVINTGSVGSLVAAPGMAQYTACKMAVRGITECLSLDLQMAEVPIDVSLLCPGPVSTNIADALIEETMGPDADPTLLAEMKKATVSADPNFITPDECANRVFEAIKNNKFWIFTHPFSQYYRGLCEAVIEGKNPQFSQVTFD